MKVIYGSGQRGAVRVRPAKLEDARKATLAERFLNAEIERRIRDTLIYGTPEPTAEMRAQFDALYGRKR